MQLGRAKLEMGEKVYLEKYMPSFWAEQSSLVSVRLTCLFLSKGRETEQYTIAADLFDTIDSFKRHIFYVIRVKGTLFFKQTKLDSFGKDLLKTHGVGKNTELLLSTNDVPKRYENKSIVTVMSGENKFKVEIGPNLFFVEDLKHMLQDVHFIKAKDVLVLYNGNVVPDSHLLSLKDLSIGETELRVVRHRLQLTKLQNGGKWHAL